MGKLKQGPKARKAKYIGVDLSETDLRNLSTAVSLRLLAAKENEDHGAVIRWRRMYHIITDALRELRGEE